MFWVIMNKRLAEPILIPLTYVVGLVRVATLNPRGMVGRVYEGEHLSIET